MKLQILGEGGNNYSESPLHQTLRIPVRIPVCLKTQSSALATRESFKLVNSKEDIDLERNSMFNSCCLSHLLIGQFRLASENLSAFTDIYKYLNQIEIAQISDARPDFEETMQESLRNLAEAYQLSEITQLELLNPDLTANERQELNERLQTETTNLISRQEVFSKVVDDGSFMTALLQHHQKLLDKQQTNA
ncbi:uncharacterized protein MELLADRAFT_69429 [Melampsora larici-populina 98AG31]|uniref:Uncharacterized protein n=1 Tax=Melampsora larici-populina (strain 98AG31 / pathotype 3-4-7) TaxID=747676 RepID=F4SAQ4_MELLP|nr:uncharacterized protein MELLADRAFT_69429 [Melampsora larici-populina 98AG31]EGF98256.1 hypothetical protein MELLADRAFT_69429 [Melampsora larici-populina 98AG31]